MATSAGISLKTPRGEIQVMEPAAFRDHFSTEPPDTSRGARLAALRFTVRDLDTAKSLLENAHLASSERMGRIVVGPSAAKGATLIFARN